MSAALQAIVMPKWGLAMQEGTLTDWLIEEGAEIESGMEICDIETSKIASPLEATVSGRVARLVAAGGATLPVGALLAVVAGGEVEDAEIDAFVARFEEKFAVSAVEAAATAPSSEVVEVDGQRINYLQLGEGGVPLVFVHGFGGDLNNWMFNQPALAEQRVTYALDLPGHGGSGKEIIDGSVDALAALLVGFMDALSIEKAHLLGHSLGGAVVTALALARPERCASLTLVSSAGLGTEINRGYIDGFIAAGSRKQMKPLLQQLFADPELVTRDIINDILKYKRLDGVDAALRALADAVFPDGKQAKLLRERLVEITAPVQVIFGAEDRIIPPEHAAGLGEGVAVHVLEGAGHMPHMEAASEVNRLIGAVLG